MKSTSKTIHTTSTSKASSSTTTKAPTESDPLLISSSRLPNYNSNRSFSSSSAFAVLRERRPASTPPYISSTDHLHHQQQYSPYNRQTSYSKNDKSNKSNHPSSTDHSMKSVDPSKSVDSATTASAGEPSVSYDVEHPHPPSSTGGTGTGKLPAAAITGSSYEIYNDSTDNLRAARSIRSARSQHSRGTLRTFSERERGAQQERGTGTDRLHEYYNERARTIFSEHNHTDEPLMEVGPEVLAVRRSALKVYEPLTFTWLIFAVGFSIFAAFSMAKWTGLLPNISYWFLLLPCWSSHIALIACHIYSAKSLFRFINDANSRRQRSDSTDHIDRAEYLPLLQRALKFGLKTGAISLSLFIFEILLYSRLASISNFSLAAVMTPLWIIVGVGILDGIMCKTQHITRVFSWILALAFMIMLVMRFDYDDEEELRFRVIVTPFVGLIAMAMGSLIYILYGHVIGYFRLTHSQLSAGILYILGTIGVGVLFGLFTIMHLARPMIFQMRVLMVAIAPLSVALLGLGAWAITRDEFEKLLLLGGQSSIQPKKLRLDRGGWTAVDTKGATSIPMFGEVRYEPLDPATKTKIVELCQCCSCYVYEDEEEVFIQNSEYSTFAEAQTLPGLRMPSTSTNV